MKKSSLWFVLIIIGIFSIIVGVNLKVGAASNQVKPVENYLAPDFTLLDLNNQKVNLKSVLTQNKLTLVNFWATWCPPCRAEIPELIEFYQKYSSKGITILAVNLQEEPSKVKMFTQSAGMKFPVLTDISGEIATKYQVYAIPTTFAVDKSGRIQWIIKGSANLDTLEAKVKSVLKGN